MSKRSRIVNADTPDGEMAGEAIVEVVENQIREHNPSEVAVTFRRLMNEGQSREESVRLIACALIVEVFGMLKHHEPFNEQRYIENLRRLPEPPT